MKTKNLILNLFALFTILPFAVSCTDKENPVDKIEGTYVYISPANEYWGEEKNILKISQIKDRKYGLEFTSFYLDNPKDLENEYYEFEYRAKKKILYKEIMGMGWIINFSKDFKILTSDSTDFIKQE